MKKNREGRRPQGIEQEEWGGAGGCQGQARLVLSLLCDFVQLTFLLGASFPHLNNGSKEECISLCP